jgi:hypothetical protein
MKVRLAVTAPAGGRCDGDRGHLMSQFITAIHLYLHRF